MSMPFFCPPFFRITLDNYDISIYYSCIPECIYIILGEFTTMLNSSNIYKDSCDFLYKKISSRAKKNKNKNPQLTNEQIYGSNPAIASNIINNKRTDNNPYLVPGRMVSHGDSKINQAEKIAENLGFYSLNDFLWGTKKEFMLYSGAFFNVLIQDALLYAEEKDIEIIQKALCFYAPYSRLHAYNRLKKNCYYKSLDFNYEDKDEPDDYYSAVARLYINIKDDFINEYIEYFYNKSTLKLNSTVSTFVSERLIYVFLFLFQMHQLLQFFLILILNQMFYLI